MMEDINMQSDRDGAIVNLDATLPTTISDDDVKLVNNMDACEDGDEAGGENGTLDDAGKKRKSPVWSEFEKITVMVKDVPVKKDWGIESKVSTITLDNASSNDSAARYLKDSFSRLGKLFFKGKVFHVRCCALILNLMVQDGLHEIKDVIQNIRESVKYLKMSSSRLHNFAEIAKQVNIPIVRRLVLDVPTRWNSTYAMLESALIFKDVFPRYGDRDSNYVWLPSDLDWEKAENVCKILEVFYDASNVFSGVSYPTSNLFLPEIWKVKQILNKKSLEFDETHYLKSMVDRMKSKFEKYWGQCNLLMSIAVVLDPRFKMKLIEFSFPKIYPAQEAEKSIRYVIDSLYELYEEYVASNAASNEKDQDKANGEGSSSASTFIKGKTKGRSEFELWAKQMDKVEPSKSDLDVYLEEGIYLCENDEDFSTLNWWKNKTLQFKLLSKMTRDILSIPISTVASESAFSAGRRVLDQYRSSMKPKTVEALICTGDWLRSEWCSKFRGWTTT